MKPLLIIDNAELLNYIHYWSFETWLLHEFAGNLYKRNLLTCLLFTPSGLTDTNYKSKYDVKSVYIFEDEKRSQRFAA